MRSKDCPWGIDGLTRSEEVRLERGSILALVSLLGITILHLIEGGFSFEHPQDRDEDGIPSVFTLSEVHELMDLKQVDGRELAEVRYVTFDQCMKGADTLKPTGMLTNCARGFDLFSVKCGHMGKHRSLKGRDGRGGCPCY